MKIKLINYDTYEVINFDNIEDAYDFLYNHLYDVDDSRETYPDYKVYIDDEYVGIVDTMTDDPADIDIILEME